MKTTKQSPTSGIKLIMPTKKAQSSKADIPRLKMTKIYSVFNISSPYGQQPIVVFLTNESRTSSLRLIPSFQFLWPDGKLLGPTHTDGNTKKSSVNINLWIYINTTKVNSQSRTKHNQ